MNKWITNLEQEFQSNTNAMVALEQSAYLRHQFEFFGLKAPQRKILLKPFFSKEQRPAKIELENIVKILWLKPQREYQYCTQELVAKFEKQFTENDIALLEFMVLNKSWWDSVDFIAANLMGAYFKIHKNQKEKYVNKWLHSKNIWLQRSALLFQLKYKSELDTELLSSTIIFLLDSNEFFINKAIGWVIREYSKTNPHWVVNFVENNDLNILSKKEALRLLNT